jgi:hypothetical protein
VLWNRNKEELKLEEWEVGSRYLDNSVSLRTHNTKELIAVQQI